MSGLLPALPHPPMAPMAETAEGHRDLLRLVKELRGRNDRQYILLLKGEEALRRQKGLLHDSQNSNSELLKVIAQREQRIAAQVVTITKLREAESVVYAQAGVSKTELLRRDHATQCRIIEAFKAEGAVKDKRLTERASEADKLSTIIDDQQDDIVMCETALRDIKVEVHTLKQRNKAMSESNRALRETNEGLVDATSNYITSYNNGHRNGYRDGKATVTDSSYRDGKVAGMDEGYRNGKVAGMDEGYRAGKTSGRDAGYADGKAVMISILRDKLDACEQEYNQS